MKPKDTYEITNQRIYDAASLLIGTDEIVEEMIEASLTHTPLLPITVPEYLARPCVTLQGTDITPEPPVNDVVKRLGLSRREKDVLSAIGQFLVIGYNANTPYRYNVYDTLERMTTALWYLKRATYISQFQFEKDFRGSGEDRINRIDEGLGSVVSLLQYYRLIGDGSTFGLLETLDQGKCAQKTDVRFGNIQRTLVSELGTAAAFDSITQNVRLATPKEDLLSATDFVFYINKQPVNVDTKTNGVLQDSRAFDVVLYTDSARCLQSYPLNGSSRGYFSMPRRDRYKANGVPRLVVYVNSKLPLIHIYNATLKLLNNSEEIIYAYVTSPRG